MFSLKAEINALLDQGIEVQIHYGTEFTGITGVSRPVIVEIAPRGLFNSAASVCATGTDEEQVFREALAVLKLKRAA